MWLKLLVIISVVSNSHQLNLTLTIFGITLFGKAEKKCEYSETILTNGIRPCKGQLLFEDNFDRPFVNRSTWQIEQYTPITHGPPDYEFVSYENNESTLFIRNNKLIINPVPAETQDQVSGILDLRYECTSSVKDQCYYEQVSGYILPPVKSAKVSSKFSFTYGKIEIKAKLPIGDWIYPQIQLLPRMRANDEAKIWIAYSRGNSHYIGPSGDVGNTVLYGGLVLGIDEPARSRFSGKKNLDEPFGERVHSYSLIWEPERITVSFDDIPYDTYDIDKLDRRFDPFRYEFYLSIGIGVGGINDFPDNYTSRNPKPWINMQSSQLKQFFDGRNLWRQSWQNDKAQLQIDSVKIWAL